MRTSTESFESGAMHWLASDHGMFSCRTSTVVVANFTAADHYPDGYLPSGTPLDVTDEANAKPWAGGDDAKLGFLYSDQAVPAGTETFGAPVLRHGSVRTKRLPGAAFTAPTNQQQFVFIEGADL